MKYNRKDKIILIVLIVLSVLSIVFTLFNDKLYKKEIMKINNIEIKSTDESTNPYGFREMYTTKIISGTITNGKSIGNKETITYEESYSSIVTEKYRVGDKVFISNHDIDGLKRDTYIVSIICIFIILMYILAKIRGLVTVLNVSINALIFYLLL